MHTAETLSRPQLAQMIVAELPHLNRFARAVSRNPSTAEDLVQSCVLRALEKHHQFQRGTNLRSWLFAILRNLFISECRHNSCAQDKLRQIGRESIDHAPAGQSLSLFTNRTAEAIARLPERDQEILRLVGIEGCTHAEAAERTGWAVGTMKSRLYRARAHLFTEMKMTRQDIINTLG